MKVKKWLNRGPTILLMFLLLFFQACASQQQQQGEELESQQQEEEYQQQEQQQGQEQQQEQQQGFDQQQAQGDLGDQGNDFADQQQGEGLGDDLGEDDFGGQQSQQQGGDLAQADDFGEGQTESADDDLANIINEMNQQTNQSAPVEEEQNQQFAQQDASLQQEESVAVADAQGQEMGNQEMGNQEMSNQEVFQNQNANVVMESEGGGFIAGAAGMPAAPGLPEMGSKMVYVVKSGDTLGKISAQIYGVVGRWRELAEFSGISDPSRIYPGDVVYYQLSSESLAFATNYENRSRQEIAAEDGDTLKSIAQRVYGSSRNWKIIWRQNDHISDPNNIEAGKPIYYISKDHLASNGASKQESTAVALQEPVIIETIEEKNNETNKFVWEVNETLDVEWDDVLDV